jgi:hypothetical protein
VGEAPAPTGRELALALTPAGLILIAELLALVYAALGGGRDPVESAVYGLWAGAGIAFAACLAILASRRRRRFLLCLLTASSTIAALVLGFAIWAAAATVACGGATDCPFG